LSAIPFFVVYFTMLSVRWKGKGKAVPVTGRGGP
jgi:hypothetical protein